MAPHRDVGEAQGHEKPDADRRQEEADADGGGEHGREVHGVDADLLGDREHDGDEDNRRGQTFQHHAEEHDEYRHRDEKQPRRAVERPQHFAEQRRHAEHAHQELIDARDGEQENHRRGEQRGLVE